MANLNHRFVGLIIFVVLFACQNDKQTMVKTSQLPKVHPAELFYHDSLHFPLISNIFKDTIKQQVEDFFHRQFDSIDFSGGFLVAKNGQLIFETYNGFSNYRSKQKINANTPIHVASISKVLTATALFRLIDKNQLELDDLVSKVLRNFPYPTITFRMLLNHRSGLPNYTYFANDEDLWDYSKVQTNQDVLNVLIKTKPKLLSQPGSKFNYCNTNFVIVALAIEKLTQLPFPKAMKKLVFEPLNMQHTFIFDYATQQRKVSNSYTSKYELILFNYLDAIYGDKNCYSTPQDLLRFDLATYNDTFVSRKLKEEAYKGYSYEKDGVKNYGLGIRIKEWPSNQQIFYHTGWWHGNTSEYIALRSDTITIVILSNKYTKKVFQSMRIAGLFGYPFTLKDESAGQYERIAE